MKAQEIIKKWEEWLPPEYHDAIKNGGDYDGTHESAETLTPHTIFCEEENGWYEVYYGLDIIVDEGIPCLTIVRCWDGDWDHIDYYENEEEVDLGEIQREADESWKEREEWENEEYPCQHCVECGEDPILVKQSDPFFPFCGECHDHIAECHYEESDYPRM